MKVTINVTAQDIEEGVACSCFWCPIARAMRRAIPDAEQVEARRSFLFWFTRRGIYQAATPQIAEEFIDAFDENQPVSPISFEVEFVKSPRT